MLSVALTLRVRGPREGPLTRSVRTTLLPSLARQACIMPITRPPPRDGLPPGFGGRLVAMPGDAARPPSRVAAVDPCARPHRSASRRVDSAVGPAAKCGRAGHRPHATTPGAATPT